eukprot:6054782-Amphidinium_carterae.1
MKLTHLVAVRTSGRNLSLLSALADGHNARMVSACRVCSYPLCAFSLLHGAAEVKRDVEACEELDLVRLARQRP